MNDTQIKMPAGMFKGRELEEIPSSYLRWVSENWNDDDVANAAYEELKWRDKWDKHWE